MNQKKRNTIILVVIIVIIAIGALLIQQLTAKPSAYAVVVSQDKEIMRLNLDEDTEVTVDASDGGYNTIEVKDQTVRVKESDCENQICVHQGQIKETYEVIVCLPHELVVTIEED